jgi:hypothetical protein
MQKVFTGLPPHYTLRVGARAISIENFLSTDKINIKIDGSTKQFLTPSFEDESINNACGSSTAPIYNEYIKYIEYNVTHTSSSVTVEFEGIMSSGA